MGRWVAFWVTLALTVTAAFDATAWIVASRSDPGFIVDEGLKKSPDRLHFGSLEWKSTRPGAAR